MKHPWPGTRVEQWLARSDANPVGVLALGLSQADNTDVTIIRELSVHPDHRRRGIGSTLWRHAIDQSRAAGRHRLLAETSRPLDRPASPGEQFAAAMGAGRVTVETRRQLDLATIDDADLAERLAAARAASADYSLVQWIGMTPPEFVPDMAALTARMSTDVPLDELRWQPEAWDADRVRARDQVLRNRGTRSYISAARHDPTGELVAVTRLDLPSGAESHGWQEDTLVLPAHRGHRLGLRIKIDNLLSVRAQEPALQRVDTWNADANSHMIAINTALGFRPVSQQSEWELTLGP